MAEFFNRKLEEVYVSSAKKRVLVIFLQMASKDVFQFCLNSHDYT